MYCDQFIQINNHSAASTSHQENVRSILKKKSLKNQLFDNKYNDFINVSNCSNQKTLPFFHERELVELSSLTSNRQNDQSPKSECISNGRSNRKTRDSGIHSEIQSSVAGSAVFADDDHNQSPSCSQLYNAELNSQFLEHYGLDGPLPQPKEYNNNEYANDMAGIGDYCDPVGSIKDLVPEAFFDVVPSSVAQSVRRKRKDINQATIRQHYYPEGGWGYVIIMVAILVQMLSHGFQLSFGIFSIFIIKHWGPEYRMETYFLGSFSLCVSLLASPFTVAISRHKSTRLTAVIGGLLCALGYLFTSFASQYHQLYISYGIIIGIGTSLTRDTSNLMVAQYFKRKREVVEIFVVSASGLGISLISYFISLIMSKLGWILSLQCFASLLCLNFILGTFYRSASLYHPQRRAILHLKMQKRKIKSKDGNQTKNASEDVLVTPVFDFTTLKSKTVQLIILSSFISAIGIYTPLIILAYEALQEAIPLTIIVNVYLCMGFGWIVGCIALGCVIVNNNTDCQISRQNLCQTTLLLISLSIFVFTSFEGVTRGYFLFSWMYGISMGAYHYVTKLYVFKKVRARNFAYAWAFRQSFTSLSIIIGVLLCVYINSACGKKSGYYFSAVCVLVGCFCLSLIDARKRNLRKKRKIRSTKSNASSNFSATTFASSTSDTGCRIPLATMIEAANDDDGINTYSSASPSLSYLRQNIFGGVGQSLMVVEDSKLSQQCNQKNGLNHQNSLLLLSSGNGKDGRLMIISNGENGNSNLPVNMIEDEEIYDDDDDELEDGITSCNKVENNVILSEFEHNIDKERVTADDTINAKQQKPIYEPILSRTLSSRRSWLRFPFLNEGNQSEQKVKYPLSSSTFDESTL